MSEVIFHDFSAGKTATQKAANAPATPAEDRQATRRAAREAVELQARIDREQRATQLEAASQKNKLQQFHEIGNAIGEGFRAGARTETLPRAIEAAIKNALGD